MRISEYIKRIDQAAAPAELFSLLTQAAKEMGFDHVAYAALMFHHDDRAINTPAARQYHAPFVAHNYPESWIRHYYDHNYQNIDPVIFSAVQVARPFLWTEMADIIKLSDAQKLLLQQAGDAGLNNGVTIPRHGPLGHVAAISFTSRHIHTDPRFHLNRLRICSTRFHDAFIKFGAVAKRPRPIPALTDRQRTCLKWVARGKTSWETGVLLGISENTVKVNIKTTMEKLQVNSRIAAVSEGYRLGLIDLGPP